MNLPIVIVVVLVIVGYGCLVRLFYLRGDMAGWERGFRDGIRLEKDFHDRVDRFDPISGERRPAPIVDELERWARR